MRLPVSCVHGISSIENNPDASINIKYDDNKYSQGYGESAASFNHLAKDNISCPSLIEYASRSESEFIIHNFDVRFQKRYSTPQTVSVNFRSTTDNVAGTKFLLTSCISQKVSIN